MTTKRVSLHLMKHLEFLDCHFKLFVRIAMRRRLNALEHHMEDIGELIESIWKTLFQKIFVIKMLRKKLSDKVKLQKIIFYMLECPLENKWTTFLDKLITYKQEEKNILPTLLLRILLQELISKEKVLKPFWNPAYKELSEKLSSPIKIGCQGLGLNFSNFLLKKQEGKSQFLMTKKTNLQNKNSQKTFFLSSISTLVSKWEKEVINQKKQPKLKTLSIKLRTTHSQKKIFDEWINTSRYVYNKTVEAINKGHSINFFNLRDKLVTKTSKKSLDEYQELERLKKLKKINNTNEYDDIIKQKTGFLKSIKGIDNNEIKKWELETPKDIRAEAVNDVCKAYKTGFSNLRSGHIKYFKLKFKKKTNPDKCICLPKNMVTNKNGIIEILPTFLEEHKNFQMGKKTIKKHQNLVIEHDTRLVKQGNEYWLLVPVKQEETIPKKMPSKCCGIDPGIRTFMTCFENNKCREYIPRIKQLNNINNKIDTLKRFKRIKKKSYYKLEKQKSNMVKELHCKVVNNILLNNDIIFYGDINSHNIVKGNKNHILNRNFNDLKFFKFKERLLFKSKEKSKLVICVKEHYTSKTCSYCGSLYNVGKSKVYNCSQCKNTMDRDINASKNILLKGIMEL